MSYQNDIFKSLGKELTVMELCPSMDLLLFGNKKEVWTHRADIEDWNRVKVLTPATSNDSSSVAEVSCACWFIDGRAIACGYQDGKIRIFGTEDAHQIFEATLPSAPLFIRYFSPTTTTSTAPTTKTTTPTTDHSNWIKHTRAQTHQSILSSYLQDKKATMKEERGEGAPISASEAAHLLLEFYNNYISPTLNEIHSDSHPSFLLTLSPRHISLFEYGVFEIGRISAEELFKSSKSPLTLENAEFKAAFISADFQRLYINICGASSSSSTTSERIAIVDISFLTINKTEIKHLTSEMIYLSSSLIAIENAISQITDLYSSSISSFQSTFQSYSSENGNRLEVDVLEWITVGGSNVSFERFLLRTLNSDNGINKLGRMMETMVNTISDTTQRILIPSIQSLLFHLSELKSLAILNRRFVRIFDIAIRAAAKAEKILFISHLILYFTADYRMKLKSLYLFLSKENHIVNKRDLLKWKPLPLFSPTIHPQPIIEQHVISLFNSKFLHSSLHALLQPPPLSSSSSSPSSSSSSSSPSSTSWLSSCRAVFPLSTSTSLNAKIMKRIVRGDDNNNNNNDGNNDDDDDDGGNLHEMIASQIGDEERGGCGLEDISSCFVDLREIIRGEKNEMKMKNEEKERERKEEREKEGLIGEPAVICSSSFRLTSIIDLTNESKCLQFDYLRFRHFDLASFFQPKGGDNNNNNDDDRYINIWMFVNNNNNKKKTTNDNQKMRKSLNRSGGKKSSTTISSAAVHYLRNVQLARQTNNNNNKYEEKLQNYCGDNIKKRKIRINSEMYNNVEIECVQFFSSTSKSPTLLVLFSALSSNSERRNKDNNNNNTGDNNDNDDDNNNISENIYKRHLGFIDVEKQFAEQSGDDDDGSDDVVEVEFEKVREIQRGDKTYDSLPSINLCSISNGKSLLSIFFVNLSILVIDLEEELEEDEEEEEEDAEGEAEGENRPEDDDEAEEENSEE